MCHYRFASNEKIDKTGNSIQKKFGFIAVTKIEDSFSNVMELPVHLVYETLNILSTTKG